MSRSIRRFCRALTGRLARFSRPNGATPGCHHGLLVLAPRLTREHLGAEVEVVVGPLPFGRALGEQRLRGDEQLARMCRPLACVFETGDSIRGKRPQPECRGARRRFGALSVFTKRVVALTLRLPGFRETVVLL